MRSAYRRWLCRRGRHAERVVAEVEHCRKDHYLTCERCGFRQRLRSEPEEQHDWSVPAPPAGAGSCRVELTCRRCGQAGWRDEHTCQGHFWGEMSPGERRQFSERLSHSARGSQPQPDSFAGASPKELRQVTELGPYRMCRVVPVCVRCGYCAWVESRVRHDEGRNGRCLRCDERLSKEPSL